MDTTNPYKKWYDATPDLTELGRLVLAYKEAKGFDAPSSETLPRDVIHIISELTEAIEEARSSHYGVYTSVDKQMRLKPEGFGIELAQAFLLIAGLLQAWNLDLRDLVGLTMAYNEGRPHKHGKEW